MREVKLYIKRYDGVGDWFGVSSVVDGGEVNCFSVECCEGRLWLSSFHCFEGGGRDLLRRSIVGSSWDDLVECFAEYGFVLVLDDSVDMVLF